MRSGAEECVRLAAVASDKIVAEEGALTLTNAALFRPLLLQTVLQKGRSRV